MFLDDDDEFLPEKIECQVRFMEEHDDSWGACYTRYIDKSGDKQVSICCETKSGKLLEYELARNLFIHAGSNLMVRRAVVIEIGGFDESFRRNQDVEFLVRILKKYKLGYTDCLGLIVYVHKKNYGVDYFDLTNQYIEKFKHVIDGEPNEVRNAIYKMIAMQQIRHAFEKRKFSMAKKLRKKYNVSLFELMRYFIHLGYRVITKKSYGYDMKKIHGV